MVIDRGKIAPDVAWRIGGGCYPHLLAIHELVDAGSVCWRGWEVKSFSCVISLDSSASVESSNIGSAA